MMGYLNASMNKLRPTYRRAKHYFDHGEHMDTILRFMFNMSLGASGIRAHMKLDDETT